MKKFYSLVLMATALLIGTNVWADNKIQLTKSDNSTTTCPSLREAFANADDGSTITLLDDYTMQKVKLTGETSKTDIINLGKEGTDAKNLTLDFNGHALTKSNSGNFINLYKGSLRLRDSNPNENSGLKHIWNPASPQKKYTITVYGTYEKGINGRTANTADLFSHLYIEPEVKIVSDGIAVMLLPHRGSIKGINATNGKSCMIYYDNAGQNDGNPRGVANGVRVDIYGNVHGAMYAAQANGQLACPLPQYEDYYNSIKDDLYGGADMSIADTAYAPYVYIHDGAVMTAANSTTSAAVYSSGYARWYIEGDCSGATGVYMKSGSVTLDGDAKIESTFNDDALVAAGQTVGISSGGNAIVVESNDHYAGNSELNIEGDVQVSTSATSGAALLEVVAAGSDSRIEEITINGGTLEGDVAIVISDSESQTKVSVEGATLNGTVEVATGDVENIIKDGAHVTTITNADGSTTIIVSEGEAPTAANTGAWEDIKDKTGQNVKWNVAESVSIESGTVTLGELQIISGTAGNLQQLTIKDGASLVVDKLMMNDFARIIVNAGGKLIVTGTQGINAPSVENILLKNEEGKRSIFLFNPAVTSNTHPNATFEILSYSWRESASNAQSEVFGIPSYNAIKSVECLEAGKYGYIQVYGSNGTWENIGFTDDNPFPYAQLNKPFAAYALTAYRGQSEDKLSFRFGGELVGNTDATLTANLKWSFFANSYTAEVDIEEFLDKLSLDEFIYVSNVGGNGYWNWTPVDVESLGENGKPTKLQPMQGFLLNNRGSQVVSEAINYKDMVYAPAVPGYAGAPARRIAANNNTAKMYLVVTSEAGAYDDVLLRESENIKSAEKYMNPDVNIYATAEEKSAIVNAEDLDNTYVGFSTVNGGNFTISFANVEGREFTLVDHETGARVEIAEGNTYEFTADANSVNDYRFEIVGRANMPTAIDNTEAVKSAKGVYTITGQYVGELNVWNTLPAGVYVVNGEKRVK